MDYPRFIARSFADKLLPEEVLNLAIRIEAFGDIRARAVEEKMLAYGEACRRAGAEAAVQICGSCDGRWPNDECPHAKNAAYANEPSPCHPRAAEAASPAAGWSHLAEIERILSKDLDASDRLDEIEAVITQALHRPAPSEEARAG